MSKFGACTRKFHNMKKSIILVVAALLSLNCNHTPKTRIVPLNDNAVTEEIQPQKTHPGKLVMEQECYICHNPKDSQESMIAPPMIAVKSYYIGENTTKEQFTEDLIKWVNDPEQESKMPDAIFEFGSMPYIPYPDDAIAQIAEYIYDYDIQRPDWYDEALREGDGKGIMLNRSIISKEIQKKNADIGMAHAMAAKTALGKKLMKAISEEGTIGAIEFCNTKALALTDSISVMNNAIIKRISDKPRNPMNTANEEELGYITYFKKLIASGKEPKPIVKRENGEVDFYYPITTNTMCLQCHGKPNAQVLPETLSTLKSLYPNDKAIGYGENEVRGLWSINFDTDN